MSQSKEAQSKFLQPQNTAQTPHQCASRITLLIEISNVKTFKS